MVSSVSFALESLSVLADRVGEKFPFDIPSKPYDFYLSVSLGPAIASR